MLPDLSGLNVHDESDVGVGRGGGRASQAVRTTKQSIAKSKSKPRYQSAFPFDEEEAMDKEPIAILMLCKYKDGPTNLGIWHEWLTKSGRPGSMLFIHGKKFSADEREHPELAGRHAPWTVPSEYKDSIVRINPGMEEETKWAKASLVTATLRLLISTIPEYQDKKFSHFALVSSDSVPLKPAREVGQYGIGSLNGKLSGMMPSTTVRDYEDEEHASQHQAVRLAIRGCENEPRLKDNWWIRNSKFSDGDLNVYSQFWVMAYPDALWLARNAGAVTQMAEDFDALIDCAVNKGTIIRKNIFATDEFVFTTFLRLYESPMYEITMKTGKIMAEQMDEDGKHARAFEYPEQLRSADPNSHKAFFGRKISTRFLNAPVTWR